MMSRKTVFFKTLFNIQLIGQHIDEFFTHTSHTETPQKSDNQAKNGRLIMLHHKKKLMTCADKQVFWSKTCSKAR